MSLVRVSVSPNAKMCEQLYGAWAHDPRIRKGDLYATLTMTGNESWQYGGEGGWLSWTLCLECASNDPVVERSIDRQVVEILLSKALGISRAEVRRRGMVRTPTSTKKPDIKLQESLA